jgi:vacuolar-type H+-ATPase subunit H
MRVAPLLFLSLLLLAGCTAEASEEGLDGARARLERARERADEKLDEARDRVAEAREQVREARKEFHDATGTWSDDARREAEEALSNLDDAWSRDSDGTDLSEIDLGETIGRVMEDVGLTLQDRAEVEVVPGSELRELLPERLLGTRRYNTDYDESGGWGIQVSHAKGKYQNDQGDKLTLTIADLGSLRGLAEDSQDLMESAAGQGSRDDYRRITTVDGFPALFLKRSGSRHTTHRGVVVVASRFVVHLEAEGDGFDDDVLENAFDKLALRRLARNAG